MNLCCSLSLSHAKVLHEDKDLLLREGFLKARVLPQVVTILFLIYPQITTKAFQAFQCYNFTVRPATLNEPGEYEYWLIADVSVPGTDLQTTEVNGLAWIAIVLYSIGTLVAAALMLWKARKAIAQDQSTALSDALAFLTKDVKPGFYWWEIVEMSRRLILLGAC